MGQSCLHRRCHAQAALLLMSAAKLSIPLRLLARCHAQVPVLLPIWLSLAAVAAARQMRITPPSAVAAVLVVFSLELFRHFWLALTLSL
jgi:hypothetical protein